MSDVNPSAPTPPAPTGSADGTVSTAAPARTYPATPDTLGPGRPGARHRRITPSVLYFGTPVVLVTTRNTDGSANITPMSSAWALGSSVVLGLSDNGQAVPNLERERECVLNLPSAPLWEDVERLAPLTGRDPVPAAKADRYRHVRDKFAAAGLTPQPAETVRAPRIAECPLQLEAEVVSIEPGKEGGFQIVETLVRRVHAAEDITIPGTQHIDTGRWHPLLYVFRHYFGIGERLGRTFKAET
ncbi:flavin reductase family protein [Actinopolymorpha pittospori]|uniref:Flavin reductase (DIM6/NTAB) family NADH-FMN oxidoreductase RutF n=1 Tax=Actinopolymorpha pittospori TaxID=648752 RepID=A0A927MRC3_9ACTN|nr:flavin reductase family protein [Actinopolymorpha pittospori]MBE1604931.1 flavin reductase (DIM6/NTAB) family NADH-FMN oxidoreductase RutF [Actinopolymorpha pittospori]